MLKWTIRIAGVLGLVIAGLFWWLLVGGSSASKATPEPFDVANWRAQAQAISGDLPSGVRVLEIGHDSAPGFAAQAGRFGQDIEMSYNAFEIIYPGGSIIVGGAVDRATAEGMKQSDTHWGFDPVAYSHLTEAMLQAEQVLMTHEHLDHVMAIARHPAPDMLAPNLVLNAPQIRALPKFAEGDLAPVLARLETRLSGEVEAVAPGVVIIPAAGHTQGAQLVFITLETGQEVLLIGDTVWNMGALEALKTRPVLTQYIVFKPDYEDRDAIKRQVRALHDIMVANPDLAIVPSHDRAHLQRLAAEGALIWDAAGN